MADLQTKTARSKLKRQRDPHYTQIGVGAYLGFRVGAKKGTWNLRWRNGEGVQEYFKLGEYSEFTAAKDAADRKLAQMTKGAHRAPSRGTVREALDAYIKDLQSEGRTESAKEIENRFNLTVPTESAFGAMKLEDVRREDFERWRDGLRKGRAPRSVNRQVRAVVAGLNFAVEDGGYVGNLSAWKLRPLKDDNEEDTAVFLTKSQRARLIEYSPPALAALLTGWSHTGSRPSELAKAIVEDFDPVTGTVTLRTRKGTRSKLRSRVTMLDKYGIPFFKSQVKDKLPKAPLISSESGAHWSPFDWSPAIRAAAELANKDCDTPELRIPDGVSAYSFRHSRISEMLQLGKLDPITVAHETGTSVAMIEKFYYKSIGSSVREKLNAMHAKKAGKAAK
jgi:integrase